MSKMNLAGKIAVITGAASGIGQGIALALAKRRCNLILADINDAGLQVTADKTKTGGITVSCHYLDVGDRVSIAAFADKINGAYEQIDVLVNNAGVALGGGFDEVSEEDFEWLLDINLHGVIRMTRAFMPLLKQSSDARIVNISSLYGIVAPPNQTAYSTSKFGVRGFSEALRHELQGTTIGVTQVHPGGVNTNIARNARTSQILSEEERQAHLDEAQKFLVMPPEKAGEIIVDAVAKRQDRLLVGNDAKVVAFIARLFPTRYWEMIQRFMN